jgi:hypothetical protein
MPMKFSFCAGPISILFKNRMNSLTSNFRYLRHWFYCALLIVFPLTLSALSVQVRTLGVEVDRATLYSPELSEGEIVVAGGRFSNWQRYSSQIEDRVIRLFMREPVEEEDWSAVPSMTLPVPEGANRVLILFVIGPGEQLIAQVFPDRVRSEDELTVLNFSPFELVLRLGDSTRRVASRQADFFRVERQQTGRVMWFELSMVANHGGQIQRILNRSPMRVYEGYHPYLVVLLDRDPMSGKQLSSDLTFLTVHDRLRVEPSMESAVEDEF